jgi:DNA-binding transcriptional ArsR family regulator
MENKIEIELSDVEKKLLVIKELPDAERLQELNWLAEEIANEFTWQMSFLESACYDAMEEVSDEAKEETGFHSIEDLTCKIDVTPSYGW